MMLHNTVQKKRIFWLGMHKVLVHTELPRLRMLGFEVFNPPYLSDVYDQSATYDWICPPSTLPQEAIDVLSRNNFFYDKIGPEAAEVLNAHFDAVVVTINPQWLVNILEVYKGKVIYRTFGQPYSLSDYLTSNGAFRLVTDRDNFWFAPHSQKVLDLEDRWLLERSRTVPYCLAEDVVQLRDTWSPSKTGRKVGLLCPRAIDNAYYAAQYRLLKEYFPIDSARVFGVQNVPLGDKWAVGTLTRPEFLHELSRMRGFAYHYPDKHVCYLPPIEFMTLGGPVAFLCGSLLSRYFARTTPGQAKNITELVTISERLRGGDSILSAEIVAAQADVRQLYQPEHVWPIFDSAFHEMLSDGGNNVALGTLFSPGAGTTPQRPSSETVLVPFHGFGPMIVREDGEYHCAEGIARVTRQVVRALTDKDFKVVVTANQNDIGRVHGFFAESLGSGLASLQVLLADVVDGPQPRAISRISRRLWGAARTQPFANYTKRIKFLVSSSKFAALPRAAVVTLVVGSAKALLRLQRNLRGFRLVNPDETKPYVKLINGNKDIRHVFVPHYYMFPEVLNIKKRNMVLYLPDYMPHFYKSSVEMGAGAEPARIGKQISARSNRILTNSSYTKSYLPDTILTIPAEKIAHVPLPYLNRITETNAYERGLVRFDLPEHFVFYPTRDRPSKRLTDFVQTVRIVNRRLRAAGEEKALRGVLTTRLPAEVLDPEVRPFIMELQSLSDTALTEVYRQATCLLFTSEMEGNFPTQVTEALHLGIPIVASNIPLITLELGEAAGSLDLVDVGDCEGYADRVLAILENRQSVIDRQSEARSFALSNFSYDRFRDGLVELFPRNRQSGFLSARHLRNSVQ